MYNCKKMYFSPSTDDGRGYCGSEETGGASVCSVVSGACLGLMNGRFLNLKGRRMCFLLFLYFCRLHSWSLAQFKEKMFGRKSCRGMRPYFSMELKYQ